LLLTSHSIVLSGLTASTTYHYAVVSTDAAGNAATSSDKTFTTQTGLLGVSLVGATQYSYTFPTNADFAYLQSKGVTFVKLIINSESLQSTLGNTSLNSTYLAAIKTAIAAPTHTTSAL
jgi:aryl-phospho-beta-D-glucosidase BglC (GH1 family)